MSHQAELEIEILSLDCLEKASDEIGMELVRDAKSYKTYAGKQKCDHLIRVKGNSKAFEIGVMETHKDRYSLMTDFFMRGHGLQDVVGDRACKLNQAYTAAVFADSLPFGYSVHRTVNEQTGELVMEGVHA
jgi:hypothetical protein